MEFLLIFTHHMLTQVLQEMLECIDRQQRNKLKLDNLSLPSPERHRPLRHQYSSDNMNVPPFNIPNLRIDQRKTSSAEDMARKNSTGSISNEIFFHSFYINSHIS
jgi:SCY1-like protein 2